MLHNALTAVPLFLGRFPQLRFPAVIAGESLIRNRFSGGRSRCKLHGQMTPYISQSTVAQMVRVFNVLTLKPSRDTAPIVRNIELELYEAGLPHDLLEEFARYGWKFQTILPRLHAGTLGLETASDMAEAYVDEVPYWRSLEAIQSILGRLATYLCRRIAGLPAHLPEYIAQGTVLLRRLEVDGYTFKGGKLIAIDLLPANVAVEVDAFTQSLRESSLPNRDLIERHYRTGEELYTSSQWEPAIGEWRKFYERILRDIADETAQQQTDVTKNTGTMKDVLDYLRDVGFFDSEERLAYGNTYGLLSSGTKPGVLPAGLARIAMVQAVTGATLLLNKYGDWQKHGFRQDKH